jgi:hypothetical protein
MSAPKILNLATPVYGWSPAQIVARVEEKVSTNIGVGALVLGFVFQLLGYVFDFALRSAPPASQSRARVAVGVAALAILLVVALYVLLLRPLRRWLLLDIARYDNSGRQPFPSGKHLVVLGNEIGLPTKLGESEVDYAKRAWHVNRILEDGSSGQKKEPGG